jgi:polar amino acid transport system substrate-binding protein
MWKTGQNAALMKKYGISNPDYLVAPEKNPRIGVDRDAEGNVIGSGAHKAKDYSALFA